MNDRVGMQAGHVPKRHHFATSAITVVAAVGIAGSALAGMSASFASRDLMLSRAQTAANALSAEDIGSLSGTARDTQTSTYKTIKNKLLLIKSDDPGTRFVYLVGERDGRIFFFADSENPGDAGYSPPGQYYPDATTRLIAAFQEDSAFIEGPVTDSYGRWFSALAPVVDQATGKTIALIGVDTPAQDYYSNIALRASIPLLLAAIPLLVLMRNRRLEAKERELTELKAQFVAVASHELRSPLSGTLWGVQSLLQPRHKKSFTPEQRQTLTSIYSNTAASIATVNEILDFSIFDRKHLGVRQQEPVDIIDVLHDTERLFALSAKENNAKIKYVGSWPKHVVVSGDPSALKRAFGNIISNAIKYSPAGGLVELAYHADSQTHTVGVRDHGIGIPKQEQKKVLQGYYRAKNATKVKTHGTGVGLWVTKMIIEQHDGVLRLDSQTGKGTSVFVTLPRNKS